MLQCKQICQSFHCRCHHFIAENDNYSISVQHEVHSIKLQPITTTADAILLVLHPTLDHLDYRNRHVRLLFINYIPPLNRAVLSKLVTELQDPGP